MNIAILLDFWAFSIFSFLESSGRGARCYSPYTQDARYW